MIEKADRWLTTALSFLENKPCLLFYIFMTKKAGRLLTMALSFLENKPCLLFYVSFVVFHFLLVLKIWTCWVRHQINIVGPYYNACVGLQGFNPQHKWGSPFLSNNGFKLKKNCLLVRFLLTLWSINIVPTTSRWAFNDEGPYSNAPW